MMQDFSRRLVWSRGTLKLGLILFEGGTKWGTVICVLGPMSVMYLEDMFALEGILYYLLSYDSGMCVTVS